MKRRYYRLLVAMAATLVVVITGVANAGAGPARRPAQDGRFFSGQGPAFYPFSLVGGKYSVDVWGRYNPVYDANNAGECLFGAYIDGIETPLHLTLSTPIPINSWVPWHFTPAVTFPAGHYKLLILPGTDCDWSVSILRLGPAAPGILVLSAGSFLHQGNTFTLTSVVHLDQTIDFSIFYTLMGAVSGTPAGTLTLAQHGKNLVSFPLHPWKDTDVSLELYTNLIFPRALAEKEGFTLGSVTATFSITVGAYHARQALRFTLAN